MDSQDTDDNENELASSSGGEPAGGVPPDPNLDPREVSDVQGDQAVGQDADSQNDEQPTDQNQRASSVEEDSDPRTLSFPRRLWKIVEDDALESVRWDDDGHTVIIEEDLFQREILRRRGVDRIFETDSMKTFIRQMNGYGFSKTRAKTSSVHSLGNKKIMLYSNPNFQRDQPGLLENIHKKGDLRNTALPATCAPTAKRKKLVPTRHSLRIQHIKAKKESNSKSQGEAPNVQGPSNPQFSIFPGGTRSRGTVARHPQGNCSPQEPNDPSRGEDISVNVRFEPRADTVIMEGAGDPLPNLPLYPGIGLPMSLFDICYSTLMASLLEMSPSEPPNEEQSEG